MVDIDYFSANFLIMKWMVFALFSFGLFACSEEPAPTALTGTRIAPETHTAFEDKVAEHRLHQQQLFRDSVHSPLLAKDRKNFTGIDYWSPNARYCVQGVFTKSTHPDTFEMETTTDRRPVYVVYGSVVFELNGRALVLQLYQRLKYAQSADHSSSLFLPFTDATNGHASYGGGRYLDVPVPANDGDEMEIDFNLAYNPYCAYNPQYSCPVPPAANRLEVAIKAGAKAWTYR